MKLPYRALWRRRLAYRRRRLHRALSKGQVREARRWGRLVEEAKERLGLVAARRVRGIDVSNHNGSVDFDDVKKAGFDFVFCKCSEGGDWKDPTWTRARVQAIRDAELRLGVYHYLRPRLGRTGADEIRFAVGVAKAAGWGKRGDLAFVIDFEETALRSSLTLEYLQSAIREAKRLTGRSPIIYTGGPFWNQTLHNLPDNFGCPLWLAAYVKDPDQYLPAAWKRDGWALWQYTDKGAVDGVPTPNVDQNVAKRLPIL
jgi:lysozyme